MCGVIITRRIHDGVEFFEMAECGGQMDSKVLSWLVIWALNNKKNIRYQLGGGWNKIGNKEFMETKL